MLQDTPITPYTRPPVSTDLAIRDWLYDYHNLRQFTAICYILPCSAIFCLPISTTISVISAMSITSTEFYQDYNLKPILPYIYINQATKLIIYTLSSHFLISFPYITSWLYHTVYVRSLIIFTLLYIIATRTHSVIGFIYNSKAKIH